MDLENVGPVVRRQASGWLRALMLFCAACFSLPAAAQSEAFFASSLQAYGDLTFPAASRPWGTPSRDGNDIFRPEGAGPFPVAVVAHTCGGIEPHIYDRAKELLDAGYMVLVLDSYTSRRHFVVCTAAGVGAPRGYKDAYDALSHLKKLPDADPERIYLVGFSLGSFVAAVMSSPSVAQRLGSAHRFRATVGWYGSCKYEPIRGPTWELIRQDTDKPVLLLMAKNDTETPVADCEARLSKLQANGQPVSWVVLPDVTHAWDKSNDRRGYVYSAPATRDAMKRTLEFFAAHR